MIRIYQKERYHIYDCKGRNAYADSCNKRTSKTKMSSDQNWDGVIKPMSSPRLSPRNIRES